MSHIQRSIIIFDQCGESPVSFKLADGDFTRLNNKYSNSTHSSESENEEINNLFFNAAGEYLPGLLDSFPHDEYVPGVTAVVVMGFLP